MLILFTIITKNDLTSHVQFLEVVKLNDADMVICQRCISLAGVLKLSPAQPHESNL